MFQSHIDFINDLIYNMFDEKRVISLISFFDAEFLDSIGFFIFSVPEVPITPG